MKMIPAPLGEARVEPSADLRPPEMQAAQVAHDRSADHDVVEAGDDEICVGDVDVEADGGENSPVRPPIVKRPMKPYA